jgi:hypothetical protein
VFRRTISEKASCLPYEHGDRGLRADRPKNRYLTRPGSRLVPFADGSRQPTDVTPQVILRAAVREFLDLPARRHLPDAS